MTTLPLEHKPLVNLSERESELDELEWIRSQDETPDRGDETFEFQRQESK